jgi:hypothetical protein
MHHARKDLTPRCIMQRGVKLQFRELHECQTKFEKNSGNESGYKVGTFDGEKIGGGKSRATVLLDLWHQGTLQYTVAKGSMDLITP